MSSLTVTVIIPAYAHRDYICAAVESVFSQTLKDFELIVINDGSPDDTADVIKPWIDSGQIQYLEQPNAGQGAARNRGIALARGEFIALLDDDDVWPADHLEIQVAALRSNPDAVMVYGYHHKIGDVPTDTAAEQPVPSTTFEEFAAFNPVISPGQALFRTAILQRLGGLDAKLVGTDDWDLYLRLAGAGPILYLNHLALYYRIHSRNASKNFWRMYRNGMRVVDKHFSHGTNIKLRTVAKTFVSCFAGQMGIGHVLAMHRSGRRVAMVAGLVQVLWIRPSLLRPRDLKRRLRYLVGPTGRAG